LEGGGVESTNAAIVTDHFHPSGSGTFNFIINLLTCTDSNFINLNFSTYINYTKKNLTIAEVQQHWRILAKDWQRMGYGEFSRKLRQVLFKSITTMPNNNN